MTEGKGTLIIRNIPEDIRRAFKAKCALDGKSQQRRVIELIEEDIREGGEGKC